MLRNLMVSKVRVKLLQILVPQPDELFYVRQLVRMTNEEINAVRRELQRMESIDLVKKEGRGNRLYYWFNKTHPLYSDLLSLVSKSVGLGGEIIKNKAKLGTIKYAMLSGRFARNLPTLEGGVDFLVVGDVSLQVLSELVKEKEKTLGREINYTVMTKDEFTFRKKRHDPFLTKALSGSRIVLIGDEEEMLSE